jgi:putative ABC transport system permease protein
MKTQNSIKPPKLADALFAWYCRNASIEDLHGDVEELFHNNLNIMSARKARIKYWQNIFALMFSYAIKRRKEKGAYHAYTIVLPLA